MQRIGVLVGGALLVCALSGAGARVRADVAPPGLQACVGKMSGDACDAGVCSAQRCSKLDYTHWDRDADVSPPTISYDCVLCVPSGGRGGGSATGGAGAGGAGGNATGGAGAGGAGGSVTNAGAGAPSTPGEDSGCGSCSTGGGDLGLRGAALGFALSMGLWLGGFRRRTPR